jgi:hypothetical protein
MEEYERSGMGGMRDDWEGQTQCKTLWGLWRDSLGAAQRWVVCCVYKRCMYRMELFVTVMTGFKGGAEGGGGRAVGRMSRKSHMRKSHMQTSSGSAAPAPHAACSFCTLCHISCAF